jgi:hypothetical protein
MEYTIVVQDNSDTFIKAVNKRINDGWKPQGGVAINPANQLLQAMIRTSLITKRKR